MKIRDMLAKGNPTVSFEIFPPKSTYPLETVFETMDSLKDLNPDFISVTYGAGGSTKGNTVDIASRIKKDFGIEAIAHLTCCTSSKEGIQETLASIKESGLENILALRGDIPEALQNDKNWNPQYRYASELIDEIKAFGDFSIGAACYPEGHVESKNMVDDLKNLKRKVDHGADFLITQLFYDNELFYQFREKMELVGVDKPVIAGILPVLNIKQVKHIQKISGCNLPPKFLRILDRYEHDPQSLQEAGIAYAVDQIIDLLSYGVDGVHIYTMNKPDPTRRIMESICSVRQAACKAVK
ncbi:5 10-methylenetetrahydrofolate reductase [Trichococcus palustris]|jgi:methylenetetrahydrofolate reductase (NADPH)|uniref:Methylenetetrahydrofolate reductase n=1 Tax=Trichococcus palustris TaxID=140314 RepID=A0A143YJB7_9LACT|nr:methylenetetrahydrofolate reductase [NAD(P)H] [Trichococcus palustris]CZQ89992.1 5 10-methylenetetrahydrofolate reductase [Trichococcus palustris]SFK98907.1 5,10-methylenetetrahydrofolate reductase (NAD(P)) [Trichococcus palustris]